MAKKKRLDILNNRYMISKIIDQSLLYILIRTNNAIIFYGKNAIKKAVS